MDPPRPASFAQFEEFMKKRPLRPAPQPRSEPDTEVQHRPTDATAVPPEAEDWAALGSTQITANISSVDTVLKARDTTVTEPNVDKSATLRSQLGDFQLLKKLGEGAMGAVYKARQVSFNRVVALKVLFKHIAANDKLVNRLHREGLAMGQLSHPNIVQGYGVDEIDGWHYIAMEYIRGKSLQCWLETLGKLSVGDAVHITLACAHGLQHAHELGLVHRDIKPENVLVSNDGDIKITDLGMVKMADEDMSLTQTGHAVGTPWYMPLEQARNAKDVNVNVDIYALGCMLYALLTGRPPFAGGTIVDVISAKERGTFPPARQSNREVPERLDLVIIKMTAKDPKYRYQTCAELIGDLERLELANEELTFLSLQRGSSPDPGNSGIGLQRQASIPDTAAELPPDEWYLRFRTPDSKLSIRKVTSAQVLQLIETGKLDSSAKISRRKADGYRALATYKEFEAAVLAKASKMSADAKTVKYRSLYKQIEEKEVATEKANSEENAQLAYWIPIATKAGAIALGVGFLIVVVLLLGRIIGH
jgi:serine/threonine-protein kinase